MLVRGSRTIFGRTPRHKQHRVRCNICYLKIGQPTPYDPRHGFCGQHRQVHSIPVNLVTGHTAPDRLRKRGSIATTPCQWLGGGVMRLWSHLGAVSLLTSLVLSPICKRKAVCARLEWTACWRIIAAYSEHLGAHSEIRTSALTSYCIDGPTHHHLT